MKEFKENLAGVHLMHALNGEFTLCGDAWGAHMSERDWADGELVATTKRVVTCARCCQVIDLCRGVRCEPRAREVNDAE